MMSTDEANVPLIDVRADELREEIKNGRYGAAGVGRMPTVTSLAKRWGTTRVTVYSILQLLQSEGLLYAKGASLIVNYPSLELQGLTKNFEAYLRDLGCGVTMENLIDPVVEIMPREIALIFNQDEGVHAVHRMRKQGITDQPLRIAENWYPVSLAGGFIDEMRSNSSMDVLAAIKEKHGLFITNVQDELVARVPTLFEVKQLNLVRTTPVLEIRRSNFSEDGTPIMWNKIIHVAPHFKFTYNYPVNHWN